MIFRTIFPDVYEAHMEKYDFTQRDDDYAPYDAQRLSALSTLPEATAAHYAEAFAAGERPFAFHLVPHVLHQGSIHRNDVAMIKV